MRVAALTGAAAAVIAVGAAVVLPGVAAASLATFSPCASAVGGMSGSCTLTTPSGTADPNSFSFTYDSGTGDTTFTFTGSLNLCYVTSGTLFTLHGYDCTPSANNPPSLTLEDQSESSPFTVGIPVGQAFFVHVVDSGNTYLGGGVPPIPGGTPLANPAVVGAVVGAGAAAGLGLAGARRRRRRRAAIA